MVKVKKDLTGMVFGRLKVISQTKDSVMPSGIHIPMWNCKCECGTERTIRGGDLNHGRSKSCGCLRKELVSKKFTTHGLTNHRLYNTWTHMKARCYRVEAEDYKYYGAKGITVCSEWKNNFKVFYDWCMSNGYKDELEIDRRDNDKGYSPDNCRFVTHEVNNLNRGLQSHNTSGYTGVSLRGNKWQSHIASKKKQIFLGYHSTKELALKARNQYIEAHGLLHKLQEIT